MLLTLAKAIIGVASVIDGDTIDIHGQRIRFQGVDAPESAQVCQLEGKPWRCGSAAATALADFIGMQTVSCMPSGKDRYKRTIASCTVDGVDIEAWLVESGWALDYGKYSKGKFAEIQREAEAADRGIWASEFQKPWEWRKR